MHLLYLDKHGAPRLSTFLDKKPEYAILSHTWGADGDEVTFQDIQFGKGRHKAGYGKVICCGQRAAHDRLTYFWVDSCCIDKTDKQEESLAIRSMFRWYREASECYVYLADVHYNGRATAATWEVAFHRSRWFTRGWTLQELLAPKDVKFFSSTWRYLGDKSSLEQQIHDTTSIPCQALQQHPLFTFNFTERRKWASKRETKVEEDIVYCLQGIFNVTIEPKYGEGRAKAEQRLTEEIARPQTEFREIKNWLSAPDPLENHKRARKLRQEKTGVWHLRSKQHLALQAGFIRSMWLHGMPGSGKSVLCSSIIDDLMGFTWANAGHVVLYFYFDFKDKQRQDPMNMLKSLITQLLNHFDAAPSPLNNLYTAHEKGRRQVIDETYLLEILQAMIYGMPRVFIVLDALDECDDWPRLLEILTVISSWQLLQLSVVCTSRREREIENTMTALVLNENIISLESDRVDDDILAYVDSRLRADKEFKRWRDSIDICNKIRASLSKGARGMFRWAVCQMDALARCRSHQDVETALVSLPPTLDETYERILLQIKEDDREYAIRILRILALSKKPVSLEELSELMLIDTEPGCTRQKLAKAAIFVDLNDIIDICRSLITKSVAHIWEPRVYPYFEYHHYTNDNQPSDDTFRRDKERCLEHDERFPSPVEKETLALAHYSVKEYLLSERCARSPAEAFHIPPNETYSIMALCCLHYLLSVNEGRPMMYEQVTDYKAMHYTSLNWFDYAKKSQTDPRVITSCLELLQRATGPYLNWLSIYSPSTELMRSTVFDTRDKTFYWQMYWRAQPLYWSCLEGLTEVTKLLINRPDTDVNNNGQYPPAIMAAALNGHENDIRLLLSAGADPNLRISYGQMFSFPLIELLDNRKWAAAELLISVGANGSLEDSWGSSALQSAYENGDYELMELMLSNGTAHQPRDLIWVAGAGMIEHARDLLAKGIDVNCCGRYFLDRTALEIAQKRGREEMVKLLLELGAVRSANSYEEGDDGIEGRQAPANRE